MSKSRAVLGLLVISLGIIPVLAQGDCGNGLPCGPVPWDLPPFPDLLSPTPLVVTADPLITPTAVPTATPIPTATAVYTVTPFFDSVPLDDSIATLEAVISATDVPILDGDGNEVGPGDVETIAGSSSLFFAYVKGFTSETFGPLAPLVNILLLAFTLMVLLGFIKITIPVLGATIGVVRKAVQLVLDFLPG